MFFVYLFCGLVLFGIALYVVLLSRDVMQNPSPDNVLHTIINEYENVYLDGELIPDDFDISTIKPGCYSIRVDGDNVYLESK